MTQSVSPDDDLLNCAIRAHYDDITAAVRARGHSRTDAVDIVHDLYVKLAENPDALKGKRSLRAFLARAAINLGIDRRRRSGLEQRLFSGGEAEALAVAAETAAPDHGLRGRSPAEGVEDCDRRVAAAPPLGLHPAPAARHGPRRHCPQAAHLQEHGGAAPAARAAALPGPALRARLRVPKSRSHPSLS